VIPVHSLGSIITFLLYLYNSIGVLQVPERYIQGTITVRDTKSQHFNPVVFSLPFSNSIYNSYISRLLSTVRNVRMFPRGIFRYAYIMRDYGNEFHHRRKEHSRWANRAIKINTCPMDRIDLLFVHDLHRPLAKRTAAASVRYARMHVNGWRRYRARGSKLKLKRIHRESFPVSRVIRARTVVVYLPFCSLERVHRAEPGTAVILRRQSTRILRVRGFIATCEYLRFSN